jgi:hypothetical protein
MIRGTAYDIDSTRQNFLERNDSRAHLPVARITESLPTAERHPEHHTGQMNRSVRGQVS